MSSTGWTRLQTGAKFAGVEIPAGLEVVYNGDLKVVNFRVKPEVYKADPRTGVSLLKQFAASVKKAVAPVKLKTQFVRDNNRQLWNQLKKA